MAKFTKVGARCVTLSDKADGATNGDAKGPSESLEVTGKAYRGVSQKWVPSLVPRNADSEMT